MFCSVNQCDEQKNTLLTKEYFSLVNWLLLTILYLQPVVRYLLYNVSQSDLRSVLKHFLIFVFNICFPSVQVFPHDLIYTVGILLYRVSQSNQSVALLIIFSCLHFEHIFIRVGNL
jgi:hypothetical protein